MFRILEYLHIHITRYLGKRTLGTLNHQEVVTISATDVGNLCLFGSPTIYRLPKALTFRNGDDQHVAARTISSFSHIWPYTKFTTYIKLLKYNLQAGFG